MTPSTEVDIGSTSMVLNTTDVNPTFPVIYVYMISVSAALLFVLLAASFVSCLRIKRQRLRQQSQKCNSKSNRKSMSDRPVSNAMELTRVSCMSSSSTSRISPQRTQHQPIEV